MIYGLFVKSEDLSLPLGSANFGNFNENQLSLKIENQIKVKVKKKGGYGNRYKIDVDIMTGEKCWLLT